MPQYLSCHATKCVHPQAVRLTQHSRCCLDRARPASEHHDLPHVPGNEVLVELNVEFGTVPRVLRFAAGQSLQPGVPRVTWRGDTGVPAPVAAAQGGAVPFGACL